MKFVVLGIFCAAIAAVGAADTPKVDSAAATTTNAPARKGDPDAAWAEIVKASRPPAPPAEWASAKPTPEQEEAWKKKLADMAEAVANQSQKFYESYPSHAKANEARARETNFRRQAAQLRGADETPAQPQNRALPDERKQDPAFAAAVNEMNARLRMRHLKDGPRGALDELEKSAREMVKDFPKETDPWRYLMMAAMYSPGAKQTEIYKLVAANGPPELREYVMPDVKRAEAVGKPMKLKLKSTAGGEINISSFSGKVVLIDFWATWCAPCLEMIPQIVDVYNRFHDKGFEIIGVSLDDDCEEMTRFTRKHKMPWQQYCHGANGDPANLQDFYIRGIPMLFLVDKKGILRDINARENLPEKVEALLKE